VKKILVIGAGLGGLAAAIRLAKAGHAVEVWEKNAEPGGKLKELRIDGFRWDTAPPCSPCPTSCASFHRRRRARGGSSRSCPPRFRLPLLLDRRTILDENAAFWMKPEVARFLDYARGIYELSGEAT